VPKTFFLGTHEVSWLARTEVPLFISRRRLALRKKLPRALGPWALDSGGFSEIKESGKWTVPPEQYVDEVRRWSEAIGNLQWAAIQDWMCEEIMLAKTGLKVVDHQRLTVDSYLRLHDLAPEIPWAPVLQGLKRGEHERHILMYEAAGVNLKAFPVVGVGTMCRRQAELTASLILAGLHDELGDRLHGFGLKTKGLSLASRHLNTADSLAWSDRARYDRFEHGGGEKNLQNDIGFALNWRDNLLVTLPEEWQGEAA